MQDDEVVHDPISTTDFVDFGLIRRISEGRATHSFSVNNAQGITYLAANALKDEIGEHPSYAFVAGFNAFKPTIACSVVALDGLAKGRRDNSGCLLIWA